MAELTSQERLQPSLLDRLTDDRPSDTQESREARVLSMRQLRASVMRDLGWLLNSQNLLATGELDDYPEVASSVLNYGLPDLAGRTASGMDPDLLERTIRQAIWNYEPRILPQTVQIRPSVKADRMSQNAVLFEIEAEIWAQPVPLHLFMKTEVDLETGHVTVSDRQGGTGA